LIKNLTYSEIANQYGVSQYVVSAFAHKWGLANREKLNKKRNKYKCRQQDMEKNIEQIKQMILQEKPYHEIADIISVGTTTLVTFCRKHGIRKTDMLDYTKNNKRIRYDNFKEAKTCTCCGINKVPDQPVNGVTLTRLCIACYLGASSSDGYDMSDEHRIVLRGPG